MLSVGGPRGTNRVVSLWSYIILTRTPAWRTGSGTGCFISVVWQFVSAAVMMRRRYHCLRCELCNTAMSKAARVTLTTMRCTSIATLSHLRLIYFTAGRRLGCISCVLCSLVGLLKTVLYSAYDEDIHIGKGELAGCRFIRKRMRKYSAER